MNGMKKSLMIIALIILFFGIPMLYDISLPKDLSPKELGDFIGSVLQYWLDVIKYALQKVNLPFL